MTQTETRIFHYDPWGHLIAETNQTGQMLAEYIYIGDQLLSMIKPGESVYYFHNDHLGTPQVLTNDSQAIAWKAVYTPFGEAVPSIQTVDNPFRFPGQYYDPETGLHYNYFRYYNPQIGRYITPDPIGLEGGINLFVYVQNDPVNLIDPLGLKKGTGGILIPIRNWIKKSVKGGEFISDLIGKVADIPTSPLAILLYDFLNPREANEGEEEFMEYWRMRKRLEDAKCKPGSGIDDYLNTQKWILDQMLKESQKNQGPQITSPSK